ncbi:MAG: Spo0B domain-containing protein [Candidatus Gastranaerophilales bacterium]|nr:Spo0B domain-containing protein [Candidatus Gastranaerophilales bacterium]
MRIYLYFCLAVVIILMLCLVWMFLLYEKMRRRYDSLAESCEQIQRLNSELRAQRHDYLNHMQVVYGMMELEEYEELHAYLEPIYRDMMKVGKAIRTSIPAVNALLMAKMGEAEAGQIDFYVEVKSDLKNLKIEPWELCKVLSNLIDNAIIALTEKEGERKLMLDINEDREYYLFAVSDNGAPIPKDRQAAIFRPGFSTKAEAGHGMGLFIVSNVLKGNGGSILLESDARETTFIVRLRKEVKG